MTRRSCREEWRRSESGALATLSRLGDGIKALEPRHGFPGPPKHAAPDQPRWKSQTLNFPATEQSFGPPQGCRNFRLAVAVKRWPRSSE